MHSLFLKLFSSVNRLFAQCEAQNLTEYALAIGVIGLASVAGMSAVASGVNQTFVAVIQCHHRWDALIPLVPR